MAPLHSNCAVDFGIAQLAKITPNLVLGPVLYSIYTAPLRSLCDIIMSAQNIDLHMYADDAQL